MVQIFFRKNISAWSLRSTPVILNSTICVFTRFISVVMDTDYGILFFTAHAVVFSEVVQPLMPNIRFVVSHVPFHLKVITPICWTSRAEMQCLLRCDTKQSCVPALSSREGLHGWTSPPSWTTPFIFLPGLALRTFSHPRHFWINGCRLSHCKVSECPCFQLNNTAFLIFVDKITESSGPHSF